MRRDQIVDIRAHFREAGVEPAKRFTLGGVRMNSSEEIAGDVIVAATGLNAPLDLVKPGFPPFAFGSGDVVCERTEDDVKLGNVAIISLQPSEQCGQIALVFVASQSTF